MEGALWAVMKQRWCRLAPAGEARAAIAEGQGVAGLPRGSHSREYGNSGIAGEHGPHGSRCDMSVCSGGPTGGPKIMV